LKISYGAQIVTRATKRARQMSDERWLGGQEYCGRSSTLAQQQRVLARIVSAVSPRSRRRSFSHPPPHSRRKATRRLRARAYLFYASCALLLSHNARTRLRCAHCGVSSAVRVEMNRQNGRPTSAAAGISRIVLRRRVNIGLCLRGYSYKCAPYTSSAVYRAAICFTIFRHLTHCRVALFMRAGGGRHHLWHIILRIFFFAAAIGGDGGDTRAH
jgi:hypothetical protein